MQHQQIILHTEACREPTPAGPPHVVVTRQMDDVCKQQVLLMAQDQQHAGRRVRMGAAHPLAVGRGEREDTDDLRWGTAEGEPMPVCAMGSGADR